MTDFFYADSDIQTQTQLILCIEECDSSNTNSQVDTRLFIGWNIKDKDYFVHRLICLTFLKNLESLDKVSI